MNYIYTITNLVQAKAFTRQYVLVTLRVQLRETVAKLEFLTLDTDGTIGALSLPPRHSPAGCQHLCSRNNEHEHVPVQDTRLHGHGSSRERCSPLPLRKPMSTCRKNGHRYSLPRLHSCARHLSSSCNTSYRER